MPAAWGGWYEGGQSTPILQTTGSYEYVPISQHPAALVVQVREACFVVRHNHDARVEVCRLGRLSCGHAGRGRVVERRFLVAVVSDRVATFSRSGAINIERTSAKRTVLARYRKHRSNIQFQEDADEDTDG